MLRSDHRRGGLPMPPNRRREDEARGQALNSWFPSPRYSGILLPMAEEVLLVFSTFPDVQSAKRIGRILVEERLADCVNILPKIESVYRWEKKVEEAEETLCLIKTTIGQYQTLESRIKALHPYEVPEIIAINLASGLPAYLN